MTVSDQPKPAPVRRRPPAEEGFTLLELLVVLAILALLAGLISRMILLPILIFYIIFSQQMIRSLTTGALK